MTAELQLVFQLLVIFQIKHYMCDFPLQTPYMLKKVLNGWQFFLPLLTHACVHATGTLLICLYFNSKLWWLALVDLVIHFLMDRIKAGDRYLGRFRDKNKQGYWNCLGFDQLVHHFTHYYIIYVLVSHQKKGLVEQVLGIFG